MRMSWLLEGRVAASGMIYPEDVEALAQSGIRAVISLTERNPFAAGTPEGITHLHLPVPDMTSPTKSQLMRAAWFIRKRLDEDKPVLVHCLAGYGRTGTVLACYLVSEGWDAEDAMREVRSVRPGSIETLGQEATVRAFRPDGE